MLMMNKVKTIINENDQFIILPHKNPDGDTIGASIALQAALNQINKKGIIVLEDPIPLSLQFLEAKILTLSEFLSMDYAYNTVFTIDSSDESRFEDRLDLINNKYLVNIDHHKTNTQYGDINLVKEASSVGEIIYELLNFLEVNITEHIGNALYTAISTDTGSFKYSNTSPKTFEVASKLREIIDFEKVNTELYQNLMLEDVLLRNKILSTLKIYNNNIGVVYLTEEMKNDLDLMHYNTDGIVESVRNISGIEVSIFLKAIDENAFKASLRSKYDFDVADLAMKFNGGGHKKAAGCAITGSLEHVIQALVSKIK